MIPSSAVGPDPAYSAQGENLAKKKPAASMAWGALEMVRSWGQSGCFLALVDAKGSVADAAWEQNRRNNRNVTVIVGFNGSTDLKPIKRKLPKIGRLGRTFASLVAESGDCSLTVPNKGRVDFFWPGTMDLEIC